MRRWFCINTRVCFDCAIYVFDHRHHIVWKYSSYDTGDKIARVEINFKCGCVLNCETKRTIAKELMERQGIRLVLSSVRSFNESPVCDVNVYRCDIKDKSNELKWKSNNGNNCSEFAWILSSCFWYDGHVNALWWRFTGGSIDHNPKATPKVYTMRCKREEGIEKS